MTRFGDALRDSPSDRFPDRRTRWSPIDFPTDKFPAMPPRQEPPADREPEAPSGRHLAAPPREGFRPRYAARPPQHVAPSPRDVAPPRNGVAPPSHNGVAPPRRHVVAPPSHNGVAPPAHNGVAPPRDDEVAPRRHGVALPHREIGSLRARHRQVETSDESATETEEGNTWLPRATLRRRRRRDKRRRLLEWPVLVGLALLVALLVRTFVLQSFYIPSGSMFDTLKINNRVVVNKLSYHLHAIHRGDVVVFNRPKNVDISDKDLIKRVIGLPGDTLSAHGGSVYVGDRRLSEPYVKASCHGTADFGPVTVPKHDIFVMGDNRCDSYDSRFFGAIPQNLVVGRAFLLIWPLSRFGAL